MKLPRSLSRKQLLAFTKKAPQRKVIVYSPNPFGAGKVHTVEVRSRETSYSNLTETTLEVYQGGFWRGLPAYDKYYRTKEEAERARAWRAYWDCQEQLRDARREMKLAAKSLSSAKRVAVKASIKFGIPLEEFGLPEAEEI